MPIQVINGRVELRKKNGVLMRVIGYSNARVAEMHPKRNILFVLTNTGRLEIRDMEGNVIAELKSCAVKSAQWTSNGLAYISVNNEESVWDLSVFSPELPDK